MKEIRSVDAIGHILCHDITQIIRGQTKDARFRKGHVVCEDDIPVLLSMGKEHLFVWEKQEGKLHENDAAQILYEICANENMRASEVKEGKIEVIAEIDGLLKVNIEKLKAVNSLGEIIIGTRHTNFAVKKGDHLAGTRIIPLLIEESKMIKAKELCANEPILQLLPFQKTKVGIIVTGSEVLSGKIQDSFSPVIKEKLAEYNVEVSWQIVLGDDFESITREIISMMNNGADMVICTGGMSVDPDDRTPLAIKNTGAEIVSYGAPVLPGAMFMLAYYEGEKSIMGLPGCVMYAKRTIFDLVLPRILAREKISASDLASLGNGGLCLLCPQCTFPNCGFGKGV